MNGQVLPEIPPAELKLKYEEVSVLTQLNDIKRWLSTQSHINARTDNHWLLSFLRGSKYNTKLTTEKLESYYTYRTFAPELFNNRDPFLPEIQKLLNNGIILIPKIDKPEGETVIFVRMGHLHPTESDIFAMAKLYFMIADIILLSENNNSSDFRIIYDFKEFSMEHFSSWDSKCMHTAMKCMQIGYPIDYKGFHFFNTSHPSDLVIEFISPFWRKEFKLPIHSYTSANIIGCDGITKAMLPNEYGGTAGTIEELMVETKQKVEKYKDWFVSDARYCSDETKRRDGPKTIESLLEIEDIKNLIID